MKNKKSGFTLLELLVVIGIIGILATLGFASYSTAQKKARDAKRKSDLITIQNCMEQNYSSNAITPYQYQALTTGALPATLNCGGTNTLTTPTDPLGASGGSGGTTYQYTVVSSTSSDYDITAALEGGGTFEITNLQ